MKLNGKVTSIMHHQKLELKLKLNKLLQLLKHKHLLQV
jgi:hypothetical protein